MAEVGLLIIFVLLLLLAFTEWAQEEGRRGQVSVTTERLAVLEEAQGVATEVAEIVGAGPNAPPEEVRRLLRTISSAAKTQDGITALAEVKVELAKITEARKRLERAAQSSGNKDSESLARQLERQSYELGDKEGQLNRYEKQLRSAGLGKGERPCWVRADGTIEYLYDVVLGSDGIRMREYTYPTRAQSRSLLPMPDVAVGEVFSASEFQTRTKALYNTSLTQNCRFFVVIYDATGPSEKDLYKTLLQAVEGHFYKRLDRGKPPF